MPKTYSWENDLLTSDDREVKGYQTMLDPHYDNAITLISFQDDDGYGEFVTELFVNDECMAVKRSAPEDYGNLLIYFHGFNVGEINAKADAADEAVEALEALGV